MFRILLVEDNEMNRDMLSRRLGRRGFAVSIATDGLQGLTATREWSPDLILMDLSLPGIDGWEATRRLKADPMTRSIPIIALTAHAMAGDRERAFDAGCDDYDMKPIDFARLLTKIEAILGNVRPTNPNHGPSNGWPNEAKPPINPGLLRHDLISPLVRIIGYCELLAEDAEAVGSTQRVQRIAGILSIAHEIRRSIDSILLRPANPGQPVDFETLVSSVVTLGEELIRSCEALRAASAQIPDHDGFLEDLDRVHQDAQLLIRMVWQCSPERVKIGG
jgi:CheY-like chemotaxis protein